MTRTFIFITMTLLLQSTSFKDNQLQHNRVRDAYHEKEEIVKQYFTGKGLEMSGFNMFIRVFKKEMKLEVWVREKNKESYGLLHTYDICAMSGKPGPKRKEGDLQVPEGVYYINHFNPLSNFHLSLGLNYPNASDKILSDKLHPGGSIYIHGNCVTIGCIPITDDKIKELYILSVEAKNNGQEKIPAHVFPARLNDTGMQELSIEYANQPSLLPYWQNLKLVYDDFEQTHRIRSVKVNQQGGYYF